VGQSFVVLVLDFFVIILFRSDSFTASKFTAVDAFALLLPIAYPILVLRCIHATAQFIAGLPKGGVEFGFFEGHELIEAPFERVVESFMTVSHTHANSAESSNGNAVLQLENRAA
jgi:hypothetical protein